MGLESAHSCFTVAPRRTFLRFSSINVADSPTSRGWACLDGGLMPIQTIKRITHAALSAFLT
jgi:hypothetical protein